LFESSVTSPRIFREIRRSGFPYPDDLIHCFVGGSELHGAKIGDTHDLDIYGVYVEPPELALGLQDFEHFTWSTGGDHRRNTPDDVDITFYSLKKWATLAAKGNPTALHFLFAGDASHATWQIIQDGRPAFLARESAEQFLGFVKAQVQRVTGERGRGAKGQRPEIEEEFGYDTKAAMHSCRLLYECMELMQKGTITLPRPEKDLLIEIRKGCWSLERFLDEINRLCQMAEDAAKASQLPESVDRQTISRLVAKAYLQHWTKSIV